MSLRALNSLERGESADPHYSTLVGIADALGTSIGELIGEPVPLGEASEAGQTKLGVPSEAAANPGDDRFVHVKVHFRKMKVAGDAAQRADHRWRREAAKSLEEGPPLAEDRTLEMLSLHNELSRVFAASVESVLEGARRGLIEIADDEGAVRLLGPEPARWPRWVKGLVYGSAARLSVLPGLIEKIEREASGQRQETAAQALYGEFNVEDVGDRLPAAVLRDPEWREELDKALAGVEDAT
jgi:transcriptional regulator with XRE-family HTH domain